MKHIMDNPDEEYDGRWTIVVCAQVHNDILQMIVAQQSKNDLLNS